MKIGITGHRTRPNMDWPWVRATLLERLRIYPPPLIGCTSLAAGADQVFAAAVLKLGGALDVIIPFPEYEATFSRKTDITRLRKQMAAARDVTVLKPEGTREDGYLRAGMMVVDRSDVLFAVWDGKPAVGRGGTAEVVAHALAAGKQVVHLDGEKKVVAVLG